MNNWKTYKFSDFVEINPPVKLQSSNEYSFVEMKDLSESQKFAIPSAKRNLTGGARFENGDTLFARITPCLENGKICQVKNLENGKGFGSTEFLVFRGKEGVSTSDFVFYLSRFGEVRKFGEKNMSGTSGRQRVNREAFNNLFLELPPIEEQRAIAKILSSLDDKIELNRQMNRTLEAMARAVFKAWFVDFEPVRANSENRPSESASPAIAKLFPSEFENDLPKGWRIGKLGEVLEAKGGTTPSTKEPKFWNGENFWATPKDLSNLQFPVLLTTERKITDEGVRQISSGILPKGTLLLSSRAPIGYLAISQIQISINQGFIAIQGKTLSNLFLLHWLAENMEAVKSRANGSTFQEISKSNFREIQILTPNPDLSRKFENFAKPLFEKIVINEKENQKLAEIRDSLLPRLISGKIRVGAAEGML